MLSALHSTAPAPYWLRRLSCGLSLILLSLVLLIFSSIAQAQSAPDTTPPVPHSLSFSGTTGTLTWTETQSPPVINAPTLTSVVVGPPGTAAGTTSDNGTYPVASGTDKNGNRYLQLNSGHFLYMNDAGSAWTLGTTLNGWTPGPPGPEVEYYCTASGQSASVFPVTGWTNVNGNTPIPSFAASGGTKLSFGASQGLTITGLSGGTVTISSVVTSGTTTTFTTSRAIASTETGGTFSIAAGAFSDSASPANPTAAFSATLASLAPALPAAPTGLTAAAGNASVSLSWTAPNGSGLTYNVKRATTSGGPYTAVSTAGAVTATTYSDSGLTNGTTYYYVVTAVSSAGEGPASSPASATPAAPIADSAQYISSTFPLTMTAGQSYSGTLTMKNTGTNTWTDAAVTANGDNLEVPQGDPDPWGIPGITFPTQGQTVAPGQSVTFSFSVTAPTTAGSYPLRYQMIHQNVAWFGDISSPVITVNAAQPPGSSTSLINDTDSGITYTGSGWFYNGGRGLGDYQDDVHATANNGDSASYTFTGTGISYITETCSDEGNVQVYLDGTLQATVNCDSASRQTQQTVWSTGSLASGSHTLKLVKQDGTYMLLDALQVTSATTAPQVTGLNLGFETPSIGSGSGAYTYNPSGASWTFSSGSGISGNSSGFTSGNPPAPEGSQVAFVQATGSISQSLSGFQAGTAYTLTVSAAQRGNDGTSTQSVQVSMDGSVLGTITPSGTNYSDFTFRYTPQTGGSHTLQFLGLNPNGGDNTVFLDNVRFSAGTASTLTGIAVSPASPTLNTGATQQFTAVANDQNGNPLSPQPAFTWSVVSGGVGTVSSSGLYSAGATAGSATVQATSGSVSGSATVTVTASGVTALPATNLSAQVTSSTQVFLTWSLLPGAASYNLYRSTTANGEGSQPYETNITYLTYDSGLTTGQTYYYKIAPVSSTGAQGAMSNEASATPGTALLPAPTNLTATASTTNISVLLSWNAVAGATSYNLYRLSGVGANEKDYDLLQQGLTGTSFTDTGVVLSSVAGRGSATYYVAGVTQNGEGSPSNYVTTQLNGFYLACPSTVTIKHGATAAVNLTLTPLGAFTGNVVLSGSATPAGTQGLFYPATPLVNSSIQYDYSITGNLYLNVGSTTAPGTYLLTITGTANGFTDSASLTLIVQ